MEDSQNQTLDYSGTSITKNTIYNLLGYGVPILVAVVVIPFLINGLGIERFGILNLAWIVIGYFSFFDFGIGKSLTKIIAEKVSENKHNQIPGLFWTSFYLMLGISLLLSMILIFFVPVIVGLINISKDLQSETLNTFYLLVLSIPLVATTAGLRGVLEAYQKFGHINVIRIFLGTFTFLIPLLCLMFTKNLFWIILFLILIRIVVWIIYLKLCFNVSKGIKKQRKFELTLISPVLRFSGWITVANIIGPFITNVDRFLIGILISAEAVAYYATPYEVVTKLLLIPTALAAVLFPVFSASFVNNQEMSKKIFYTGIKFIFIILYPVIFIIVTFSYQGIDLWLGSEFARESAVILQILAMGVLFNSIAYVPFNFFQGVGKPSIPAILNLIELPIYLFLMWIFIQNWGIKGAAVVWLLRIVVDTLILFLFAYRKFDIKLSSGLGIVSLILSFIFLIIPSLFNELFHKMLYSLIFLSGFLIIVWKYFVTLEERNFLITKLRQLR